MADAIADGAFLFPEDASSELQARVRVKALLDQPARLPAQKQKLLILDATEEPAFTDLGLVHNDFASAVEELNSDIAAVPEPGRVHEHRCRSNLLGEPGMGPIFFLASCHQRSAGSG